MDVLWNWIDSATIIVTRTACLLFVAYLATVLALRVTGNILFASKVRGCYLDWIAKRESFAHWIENEEKIRAWECDREAFEQWKNNERDTYYE